MTLVFILLSTINCSFLLTCFQKRLPSFVNKVGVVRSHKWRLILTKVHTMSGDQHYSESNIYHFLIKFNTPQ